MCNPACLAFVKEYLRRAEVQGKDVLEIGARDVNGSVRSIVESFLPRSYVGVDIQPGKGVDRLCNAEALVETFGPRSFDLVLTTEMVEHVEHWREVFSNLKRVLRPNGTIYMTTRSKGFPYHCYPGDYWRYSVDDMEVIFADMRVLVIQTDPSEPGVFVKARRPRVFTEANLSGYELYAIQSEVNK